MDEAAAPFDARELVGLLADADRRRVVAALLLDATTIEDVRHVTGLDARAAGHALRRLVDTGLVVRGDDGTLHLLEAAFTLAARAEAQRSPRRDEHAGEPQDVARVLRSFVRDGRILSVPMARPKRLVLLDWLSQKFEPGRRYSEAQVNLMLGQMYADTAALRRYLVDEEFLSRDHGVYWRSGGSVSTDSS
jgi:hypothetical protein